MINKIRDMDGSDKAKLAVIIVLLVITVVIALTQIGRASCRERV